MINEQIMDLAAIKAEIKKISELNVFTVQEIVLHFQTLRSAGAARAMMEAPGLYYPDLPLIVISKSGMARGHASMNIAIQPLLPESKKTCYGFVLYPETFVRTCLDKVLRRSTKIISRDMRISMENVFNRKHFQHDLIDSDIEKELIDLLKRDLNH